MDSISVETPSAPPRLHPRPPQPNSINGSSRSNMKQRNLPPIPSVMEAPDPPNRSHPIGRSIPAPPLARASSNSIEHSSPQLPPPRAAGRRSSNSTPGGGGGGVVKNISTHPILPPDTTNTTGPPIPVRPSGKPQAPPKPQGAQKPPVPSNRPKPSTAPKPVLPLSPSSPSTKPENLTFEEKIQKIHEDAPVLKELVKNHKPGVAFQLEDYAVLVDCMVNEANSATNDSSVQFKRCVAALRSQIGYLKDPSFHNETIRIVKVIDMIVTKTQQLSTHLH